MARKATKKEGKEISKEAPSVKLRGNHVALRKRRKKATRAEKEEVKESPKIERYLEGVGRRKTAIARVRLFPQGGKQFLVNNKPVEEYFPTTELIQIATSALDKMHSDDKFGIVAMVKGGGLHAQAEAIRHGTARALVLFNPEFRKRLKRAGYLTRDARMRERKKFGLKRARRAPQWQKR